MFIWDEEKNNKLIKERNISFEEVVEIIANNRYLDIIKNPAKDKQYLFVLHIKDYVYAVPFIIDFPDRVVLKTIFPSRKLYKKYRRFIK